MPIRVFNTFDDPFAFADSTSAFGVNGMDQIVGAYRNATGRHGFLLSGGTYTTLDDPSAKGTTAIGINTSGQIVGIYQDASFNYHGFLLSGGIYTTLDEPFAGVDGIFPNNINDAGQIVGTFDQSLAGQDFGFGFLLSGGVYTTLNDPSGVVGSTVAQGINNSGQIVGAYLDANNFTTIHGFLYSGGTYTTFDDPLATTATEPFGINDMGQIVGTYDDATDRRSRCEQPDLCPRHQQ
jgi:uncharacterized membrane protein